jgi:hypothetical protein
MGASARGHTRACADVVFASRDAHSSTGRAAVLVYLIGHGRAVVLMYSVTEVVLVRGLIEMDRVVASSRG